MERPKRRKDKDNPYKLSYGNNNETYMITFIDNNIELSNLEKKIVKEVLPKFFKYCGFEDTKKLSYQIALHTNTKHYHFHFSFIEKGPNYKCSDGKIRYRRKGSLSNKEIKFLKNEIIHVIDRHREFTPLVISSNQKIEEIKKYFKSTERNFILRNPNNLVLEENILRLGKMLYDIRSDKSGKIKYNSIYNKEIKELTKNIKKYLFKDRNSELYKKDTEFKDSLNRINNYFYSITKGNNISLKKYKSEYSIKKQNYIDNYVYNAIVNHAFYKFGKLRDKKGNISDNDILQETILKIYNKNRKQTKYDLFLNYISHASKQKQYKNKYQVEQTIKK